MNSITCKANNSQSHLFYSLFRHGNHKVFSCTGLVLCIAYLRRLGHPVKVVVPETRSYVPQTKPIKNQEILQKLCADGSLRFTTPRVYDDRYVDTFFCVFFSQIWSKRYQYWCSVPNNFMGVWYQKEISAAFCGSVC